MLAATTSPRRAYRPSERRHNGPARRLIRSLADAAERPRGDLPEVIVTDRDAWGTALGRPGAVVVDTRSMVIRRGTARADLFPRKLAFRLVQHVLERIGEPQLPRAALRSLLWPGEDGITETRVTAQIVHADRALRAVGLSLETIWGGALRVVALPGDA